MESMEQAVAKNLDELIKSDKITKASEIILFGANKSSMYIYDLLGGFDIVAIIDNDTRKTGQIINGLKVYTPEEYLNTYNDEIRILIASEYYAEMCDQLEVLGYRRNIEVFPLWKGRRYYDTSKETFDYHSAQAIRGKDIYDRLVENDLDMHLFICPYAGTGDIYLVGMYLEKYIKQRNITNYVLTVIGKGCEKIANLFELNCINLSQRDTEDLLLFSRVVGLGKCKVRILNDGYLQVMVKRMRGYKGVDFHTMFQNCVFEVDEKLADVSINQQNADDLFEQYNLIKGKTVLLSPYANTIYSMPNEFWENLADELVNSGYTVCTNSCGENEPPIKGTEGVFIPYNKVVDFLDKAGCFVGMRSGLCDIVSSTKAKMVVLYPDGNIFGTC